MYSGTDPVAGAPSAAPTAGGMPAWAGVGLNPAGYPPAGSESVDWAALAQQWIIMKEAGPPPQLPMPVQPVQVPTAASSTAVVDMVVENDTDSQNNGSLNADSSGTTAAVQWNWNMPPPNWSAPASGFATANLPPTPKPPPLLPTPPQQQQPYNNYSQGYIPTWNAGGHIDAGPLQGKIIRPHNKRFSKVNVPVPAPAKQPLPSLMAHPHHNTLPPPPPLLHHHHTPNQHQPPHPTTSHHVNSSATSTTLPTLDAARRKQLPAWIRDGLEKMERDKQRQMEKLERDRQRALVAPQEYDIVLGDAMMGPSNQPPGLVPSKFNDDMEENGNDLNNSKHKAEDSEEGEEDRGRERTPPQLLTHEELMIIVRRTMTEILLKVTNESIKAACMEELQRYNRKQRSGASKAAMAGAAALGLVAGASAKLTGTLGLAAYADSGSSSESDDDDDDADRSQPETSALTVSDDEDSDSHLKEAIRRRKAEFTKTEREIEQRLAGGKSRGSRDRSSSLSSSKSRTSSPDSDRSDCENTAYLKVPATNVTATVDGRPIKEGPSRATDVAADYAQVDATQRGSVDVTGDERRQRKHRDDRQKSKSRTPVKEGLPVGATSAKTDGSKRRNSSSASIKDNKGVELEKSDKSKTRTTSGTSDNKSKSSLSRQRRSPSREKRRRNDRHRSSSTTSSSSRSRSNRRDRDKRRRSRSERRSRTRSRDRHMRRRRTGRRSRSRDDKSSRVSRDERSDRRRDRSPNLSRRRSTRSSSSSSAASTRRRRRQSRHDSRQRSSRRSRSRSRSRSSRTSRHRRGSGRYSRSRSRSRSRGSRRK